MAKSSTSKSNAGSSKIATGKPQCLIVARAGIDKGSQFAQFMSALIGDLIEGRISPQTANAACNAGGKLLKVVEMQYKYGQIPGEKGARRELLLTPPIEAEITGNVQ